MDTFLEKYFSNIFFKENWTDSADFLPQNMTLKVRNWHFLSTDSQDLGVIFLWWPKLCTGFDVEPEIQILKSYLLHS